METKIECGGMTFSVKIESDGDTSAPWDNEDFHGPVRYAPANDHGYPNKRPGELVLTNNHRRGGAVYDFADACKIARRDDWGGYGMDAESAYMTRRQWAAQKAREDYERLRAWCSNEWCYVGVIVTLLDIEGNETDAMQSLWGIESDSGDGYLDTIAADLVGDCVHDVQHRIQYDSTGGVYRSGARLWIVSRETAE